MFVVILSVLKLIDAYHSGAGPVPWPLGCCWNDCRILKVSTTRLGRAVWSIDGADADDFAASNRDIGRYDERNVPSL